MNRVQGHVNWLELYRAALLELDKEKLLGRIELAQKAIQERARELAETGNGSVEEKQKIGDALASLRTLLNHEVA
jgi:hypothetical protein